MTPSMSERLEAEVAASRDRLIRALAAAEAAWQTYRAAVEAAGGRPDETVLGPMVAYDEAADAVDAAAAEAVRAEAIRDHWAPT